MVEENMTQVAQWYNTVRPEENNPPVVGNDDSHGAVNGKWFDIGRTYLMARSDSKEDIFEAIRQGRSCAAEQYHGESCRIYGNMRMVRLFSFLENKYFPLHRALCAQQGQLMLSWLAGDQAAGQCLKLKKGETLALYHHFFAQPK